MQDLMFEVKTGVKNKTFSRGGHLLANLVPMLEKKKKKMRTGIFPELGSAQRCHGLGKENTFCRKGSGFQVVRQNHSFFFSG